MPTISNAALTINTNKPQDQATVRVSCDIEFTQVEVNAMNMLGLQYTLHCHVYNHEVFDDDRVVSYHHVDFPRVAGEAQRYEHANFDSTVPMEYLHERMIGKDQLVARLKLKNEETGVEDTLDTDTIAVDLAA